MSKKEPKLAEQSKCVACLACVASCPTSSVVSYMADDGHRYVKVNADTCIGCLKCEKICYDVLNNYGDMTFDKTSVFYGWSNNEVYRSQGTSGGIFAALADTVIRNGGGVIGAYFNGTECYHRYIESIEEIPLLQGSKYVASSMEYVYREIEGNIAHRDILFCGLGCQCAAVNSYFKKKKTAHKLITVDMICGGVPSAHLLNKYLNVNPGISKIVSFRSKNKYQLTVAEDGEERVKNDRPLPLAGFSCELTNRYSCYDCVYAQAHRTSDITIGDLWNYDILPEEHSKGISSLFVHSDVGMQLLENSNLWLGKINWTQAVKGNLRMVYGKKHIYWQRRMLEKNMKRLSFREIDRLYGLTIKPYDLPMVVFKVYRKMMDMGEKKKALRYFDNEMQKKKETEV